MIYYKYMMTLKITSTQKDEVIDITEEVAGKLAESGISEGVCTVFVAHTTSAITTADLDPGTDLDFLDALRGLLPQILYRHPHDPSHTPDHILSSIIGPSITVPFEKKKLVLGVWQRIVLIELDGPRKRNVHLAFVKV
jgi:secondary thiamine-phosphate synthase enzyme